MSWGFGFAWRYGTQQKSIGLSRWSSLFSVQGLAKETGGSSAIFSLDLLNYKRWRQFDQERLLPVFFFLASAWIENNQSHQLWFVFMYTRYTDSDNMQLRHWKHCEPCFGLRTSYSYIFFILPYTPSPNPFIVRAYLGRLRGAREAMISLDLSRNWEPHPTPWFELLRVIPTNWH